MIKLIIALVVDLINTSKLKETENESHTHTDSHLHTADKIIIASRTGHAGINYMFVLLSLVCACVRLFFFTPLELYRFHLFFSSKSLNDKPKVGEKRGKKITIKIHSD